MRYLLIILLLAIISACSCKKDPFKDDKLSLKKRSYNGNELRIDGYYYFEYGNKEKMAIYFLYRNGILMDPGSYNAKKYTEFENSIIQPEKIEKIQMNKDSYGLFVIENSKIKLNYWEPGFPHKAFIQEGDILNDTTFRITSNYRVDGSNKSSVNWVYHFKQFSPKPDSTNQFIP